MKNQNLFVFAGEPSGDLHGANLLKALRKQLPMLEISGVGGKDMRAEGIHSVLHMEDFEVMGFTDVLLSFPKLFKQFYHIRDHILAQQPAGVILIDYPGFNLRLSAALRKKGYQGKLIQYISPTVWAWGKHRIDQMAANLDLLLLIYPFEKAYFAGSLLNAQYVGHPLGEILQKHSYHPTWKETVGIPTSADLIAIFPGSRKSEIRRHLPLMMQSAQMLKNRHPNLRFAVSCAQDSVASILQQEIQRTSLRLQEDVFLVPKSFSYELMRDSHTAMAKSGTVTLELALHNRPTAVIYNLSCLNRLFAKYFLKLNLPYYCIVNILAGKQVYPELIAQGLSSQNLFTQMSHLYAGDERMACMEGCKQMQAILQKQNASDSAAILIKDLLSC